MKTNLLGFFSIALTSIFLLLGCLPAASSQDTTFVDVTDDQAVILMAASYVGLAKYCRAYGVDYIILSKDLNANANQNIKNDPSILEFWRNGFQAGIKGDLFSPLSSSFISVSSTTDISAACNDAYQQTVKLSRIN